MFAIRHMATKLASPATLHAAKRGVSLRHIDLDAKSRQKMDIPKSVQQKRLADYAALLKRLEEIDRPPPQQIHLRHYTGEVDIVNYLNMVYHHDPEAFIDLVLPTLSNPGPRTAEMIAFALGQLYPRGAEKGTEQDVRKVTAFLVAQNESAIVAGPGRTNSGLPKSAQGFTSALDGVTTFAGFRKLATRWSTRTGINPTYEGVMQEASKHVLRKVPLLEEDWERRGRATPEEAVLAPLKEQVMVMFGSRLFQDELTDTPLPQQMDAARQRGHVASSDLTIFLVTRGLEKLSNLSWDEIAAPIRKRINWDHIEVDAKLVAIASASELLEQTRGRGAEDQAEAEEEGTRAGRATTPDSFPFEAAAATSALRDDDRAGDVD